MPRPFATVRAVLRSHRGILGASLGIALLASALTVLLPWLGKREIEILEGRGAFSAAGSPALLFLFFAAAIFLTRTLASLSAGADRLLDTLARERLAMEMDRHLYRKMEELDAGFLENPQNRRLIYIFFDIGQLPWTLLRFLTSGLGLILSLAAILPIIALTSPRILALISGFGALQLLVTRSRIRRENAFRVYKEKALAGTNELVFLLRYHFHQLIAVSGEGRVMPRYFQRRSDAVALEVKEETIKLSYQLLYGLTENLTLLATALIMGVAVLAGEISIGTFTMVTAYAVTLQASVSQISQKFSDYYHIKTIMLQLGFFLSMKSRIDDSTIRPEAKGQRGPVRLRDITFAYPGLAGEERAYLAHMVKQLRLAGDRREMWSTDWELVAEWERLLQEQPTPAPVLRGLSLTFPRDSVTAVVGPNGSGKTTLTRLLMRNYDPASGSIHLGETPLVHLTNPHARAHFSLVTQQPFLLESFSIRENLLLGCTDSPGDEEIFTLLGEIGFGPKAQTLPRGLDSLVGDEVSLSGGEAQMLVITRALLQRRPCIIIDEGTNQLDAEHELAIMKLLHRNKGTSSVIIITHRMTTAKKADLIAVLDGGLITQHGTHGELLDQGGLYRRFWEMQVVD